MALLKGQKSVFGLSDEFTNDAFSLLAGSESKCSTHSLYPVPQPSGLVL
jgi:hypothetical protein